MIEIVEWTESDFQTVHDLLRETWLHTYASFIPVSDITGYLESTYNTAKLQALYQNPSSSGFLALDDGKPVAWMRTNNNTTENRFYISSIYVLPGLQGKGIGKQLIQHALEMAHHAGYDRIYLGVMKQNEKSLQWYQKIGFVFEEEMPFTMGSTEVPHLIGYKIIS